MSPSGPSVCACLIAVGDEKYFKAAAQAARPILGLTDLELVIATDRPDWEGFLPDPRLTVLKLDDPGPGDRAARFLSKFAGLEAALQASDSDYLLLLDGDTRVVAPITGSEIAGLLGDRDFAMVEQRTIRGSQMDRSSFRRHYIDHSLRFIAPDAVPPSEAEFRFFNSGVVVARRQALEELLRFARGQIVAADDTPHQVGEHMIADQDYFQYWVNTKRPGSCMEIDSDWNHCFWWDDPWPLPTARILHFSNFCNGPTDDLLAGGFEAIIVTHESVAVLEESVRAARVAGAVEVLVVDNASTDGSAELAVTLGCKVVQATTNKGFAAGANAGARAATEPLICFINPDCLVDRSTAERAAQIVRADPLACAVPDFLQGDGNVLRGARGGYTRRRVLGDLIDARWPANRVVNAISKLPGFDARSWQWPIGACVFISRTPFLDAGGFDESYFVYMEDVAFGRSWASAGGTISSTGTTVEHLSRRGSEVSGAAREKMLRDARVRYARQEFGPVTGSFARALAGAPG
ncbi:MAG: glycosyltransferase [Actinobacteria bacterium]|uniref:Unannotated protein n=1 Tax=freshwater metagenome TaxID=449393 RepID=A0A6J5ZGC1_9ZZZZ|nr:glycosyltransferase [Actinomycetota bacterium]